MPLRTRRIAMLAYEEANTVDVVGPLEVFSAAATLLAEAEGGRGFGEGSRRSSGSATRPPAYAVEVIGPERGLVRTSSGVGLQCDRRYDEIEPPDTLLVAGGSCEPLVADDELLAWLRASHRRVRRLASVCTGAFLLAAAGLLDGRRATTHWRWAGQLGRFRPAVRVESDALYVRDGKVYTSAGVTAGMDLALCLVEEDHGRELALSVARHLVVFLKRPGGQSQFSAELAAQSRPEGPLGDLPQWILEHLDEHLPVERLAERVAMSPRNFARVFTREMGATPAKFVERARVERARRSLEGSRLPIESIAEQCGFGTAERMRRTFRRHLRVVPRSYRERFEARSA